jgi:hypothetical protein
MPKFTAQLPSLTPLLQLSIADDRGKFCPWHDNPAVDTAGDKPWATGWYLHTPVFPWCYIWFGEYVHPSALLAGAFIWSL